MFLVQGYQIKNMIYSAPFCKSLIIFEEVFVVYNKADKVWRQTGEFRKLYPKIFNNTCYSHIYSQSLLKINIPQN